MLFLSNQKSRRYQINCKRKCLEITFVDTQIRGKKVKHDKTFPIIITQLITLERLYKNKTYTNTVDELGALYRWGNKCTNERYNKLCNLDNELAHMFEKKLQ